MSIQFYGWDYDLFILIYRHPLRIPTTITFPQSLIFTVKKSSVFIHQIMSTYISTSCCHHRHEFLCGFLRYYCIILRHYRNCVYTCSCNAKEDTQCQECCNTAFAGLKDVFSFLLVLFPSFLHTLFCSI